jgi:tetratricopeptide (TPR) repeat protein
MESTSLKKSESSIQMIQKEKENTLAELEEIYKLILPSNKNNNKRSRLSNNSDSSEFLKSSVNSSNNFHKKEDVHVVSKRQRLLLNLAHVCLMYGEVNLCSQILGYLKETELVNDDFLLELEFIECEQAIKELKHKQEKYSKNVVKLRNECINKLHEALKHAQRSNSPNLLQLGCIMQWNLCLPLIQPGLRNQIRKPLQYVADCLEEIDSMEWLLRCQIHFELAKCDEEIEQLQTAEQHLLKAIRLDDGNIYKEQLDHSLKRLRLRAELYKTPDRIEDQSAMILEQCVVGGKSEKKLKPAVSDLLASLNSKQSNGEKSATGGNLSSLEIKCHLKAINSFFCNKKNQFL